MTISRPMLLITAPFDADIAAELSARFDVHRCEPDMSGTNVADHGLGDQLHACEALVCEVDRVDARTLAAAPHLRLVVSCRGNPVNVDLAACTNRSVIVVATPARNADVTADFAFALLLATVRHVSHAEAWLREKSWNDNDALKPYRSFRGIGLSGRRLGIVGGGAIGSRMVDRARGFGMDVLVYDPYVAPDAFDGRARLVDLDTLMASSDIVSVHAPLNAATTGLIGTRELALMRPDTYLINAGRAAIVNEDALLSALRERRIAGAGLDVFWTEPLPHDHELFALDNVTITPHVAGASDDVVRTQSVTASAALRDWASGQTPAAVANPEVLASTSTPS